MFKTRTKIVMCGIIVSMLAISGCVSNQNPIQNPRYVNMITTDLELLSSEIENISYFDAKEKLNYSGYTIENRTDSILYPGDYIHYRVYLQYVGPRPEFDLGIHAREINGTKSGYVFILYNPSKNFPTSFIENRKQYIINNTNEIADICNLTLDWGKAKWTVNYAD